MKVVYLTHFYPPSPCGRAGVYTAALAEAFQKTGIDCHVLYVGDWDTDKQYFNGYSDDVHNGVPVRRLHVNWTKAPRLFDYLYDNPIPAQHIRAYLERTQPDLVHVTSCYTLSAQAIVTPQQMGIPVVVHLVDIWFICPTHQLLRKDGRLCYGSKGRLGLSELHLRGL